MVSIKNPAGVTRRDFLALQLAGQLGHGAGGEVLNLPGVEGGGPGGVDGQLG